jgi:hypothetical protein
MTRPKRIRVLGQVYKVIWEAPESDTERGWCDLTNKIIHVAPTAHPVEVADTLLHELLHAIVYGQKLGLPDDMEEQVVCALASGLTAVLQDNLNLRKYLLQDHNKE